MLKCNECQKKVENDEALNYQGYTYDPDVKPEDVDNPEDLKPICQDCYNELYCEEHGQLNCDEEHEPEPYTRSQLEALLAQPMGKPTTAVTITMSAETKVRLDALSTLFQTTGSKIVREAITSLIYQLQPKDRLIINNMVDRAKENLKK